MPPGSSCFRSSRRREPRRQGLLSYVLLGALAVVVFGSLVGEFAGQRGWFGDLWQYLGDQGLEYVDLGRFWQVLLIVGMLLWVFIIIRGLRRRLAGESFGNMPWLFLYAALAIPAFYAVSLLASPEGHTTINDYWRFWMVHLWVEDFLELFTTAMVAYIFVLLGVVRERTALRVIYLDIIIYSLGGVIGTMHHLYFSGTPAATMALGALFSAAEIIPLTLLTVEAWSFVRLGARDTAGFAASFPHYWAVMFLIAVGFWNFLGAGVFGFLINLPIVSYYEIGTGLTANHAHTAMMGVYGMLAAGLAVFCLRYLVPEKRWSDRAARISFWSLNARAGLDGVRQPLPARRAAALPLGGGWLLAGAHARLPEQHDQHDPRVGPPPGRRALHPRRGAAAALARVLGDRRTQEGGARGRLRRDTVRRAGCGAIRSSSSAATSTSPCRRSTA